MKFEVYENTTVSILELGVKQKFKDLLPPLTDDQKKNLGESIRAVGVNIPIVAWFDGEAWWVADGHNRQREWLEARAENPSLPEPPVYELTAGSEEEVLEWIITQHINRRNLTPEQVSYFRGKVYRETKQDDAENLSVGKIYPPGKQGKNGQKRTSEAVAEQFGVSEKTIRNDADFSVGVDQLPPEEKAEVLAGKSNRTKREVEALGRGEVQPGTNGQSNGKPSVKDLAKPFTGLVNKIGEVIGEFERMADKPGGEFIDSIAVQEMKTKGRNLQEVVKARRPVVHKVCEGKGCKACGNRGYMKG